ncbi:ABC-F family ATP-binding cassette domain-containing protein [Engelhardtia mirabilis]|uniref:Putative ABC transporter ATP-binding protein YheS n=1 Tax=Engelhardtia mirabilis TaxID=2528011 RepID=A0A518BFJ2_9BACT|nr:putative ABC transporter ATP-binding protein YheS [Planctomycetes bacterium Pla133]QDV00074.1 putative ABC transporter ATP-binding protein YheS [Planctomycetes bacterium Pla86]
MSLLIAENLRRLYGGQEVLRGASVRVEVSEKLGIVGRNGGGKSTLLRLIAGQESPDFGTIAIARGTTVGYVPQRPEFKPGEIAFDHVEGGLEETRVVQAEIAELESKLETAEGDALERYVARYGELTERMHHLSGWNTDLLVEQVLSGIGLAEKHWRREAGTLSGGEKARVALARQLVRRPDLLLLDEPTNHLDLDGIEWLEDYLREFDRAVLLVSHDRRLLNRVVDGIFELEWGQVRRYPGNYEKYVNLRQERFQSELKAYEQQRDQMRKEQAFIKKHMGSQRTSEAKGRQKKLDRVDRLERPHDDIRRPVLRFGQVQRSGESVIEGNDLAIGFGTTKLHQGLDLRVSRGDRIGIVGPNGAGKTTLIRALAGRSEIMAGELKLGHKTRVGYFDQESGGLDPEASPYESIRRLYPTMPDVEIRGHLARFLFRGDDVDKPISGLSGGERARVALALLILTEPTWLALDEPTNHLDLAARTALEELLAGFPGAMLCISHDREFLDNLCNRIVELSMSGIREFRGNYSEYRAAIASEQEAAGAAKAQREESRRQQERQRVEAEQKQAAKAAERERSKSKGNGKGGGKGQGGKPSGGGGQAGSKASAGADKIRNPQRFERLEKEIIALEEKREALMAAMVTEEVYRDADALRGHQFDLAEVERDLEDKNRLWENWS